MYGELKMSKNKFVQICEKYYETVMDETDMMNAFCIVHDLILAEADAIDSKAGTYTDSGLVLRDAAQVVHLLASDMEEAFEEVVTE